MARPDWTAFAPALIARPRRPRRYLEDVLPAAQTVFLSARRLAIRGVAHATTAGRLDARRAAALAPNGGIVLNLHSVSPSRGSLAGPISPETFDSLVGWLKRHFRVLTIRELAAEDDRERPFAVLSFDDGYRDFLEYAMPILERHGVRANQNLVPACVDAGLPPWNVRLLDILGRAPSDALRAIRLPGLEAVPLGRDHETRVRFSLALTRFLKTRSHSERVPLLEELMAQLGELAHAPTTPMLSRADLPEVSRHHEVGLHSYAHDSMEYESDRFFEDDLDRCLDWSGRHLGSKPTVFAFPNGSHRQSQIEIAKDKGFSDVLLVGEKASHIGAEAHPRITVYGADPREVRMRIARSC